MPGFPTSTNLVGVNANRRDRHKPAQSPALHLILRGRVGLTKRGEVPGSGFRYIVGKDGGCSIARKGEATVYSMPKSRKAALESPRYAWTQVPPCATWAWSIPSP